MCQSLGPGASLDLVRRPAANARQDSIAVVVGAGRGSVLTLSDPMAGIWIPLRGRLHLATSESENALLRGDLRITEMEPRVRATGRGNARWIALLGSRPAWRRALDGLFVIPTPDPLLLPMLHRAERELTHHAVSLARAFGSGDNRCVQNVCDRIIESVVSLQERFAEAVARCPGRTYAQRRQVFLRLQRVRNYLQANCHLDLDNDVLARRANYSPWHFIRAFRAAYGETPHAYLVRQRLEHARRLLRTSPLAIAEVAYASGFENRCAFSRLFRQHFGTTAGAMRRQRGDSKATPLSMRH
ncbi:MAG: AraC family transcriptional regulator [Rhodanobacteraceae bacterium]